MTASKKLIGIACRMIYIYALSLCILPQYILAQQSRPDSLQNVLVSAKDDTNRVNTLIALCWELRTITPETAIQYAEKAFVLATQLDFASGQAKAMNNIGVVYHMQGEFEKALEYYDKALAIYENTGRKKNAASVMSNIASVYQAQNQYSTALEYYKRALALASESDDRQRMAIVIGSVGIIYYELGDYAKSLACYLESLKIREEIKDRQGMAYAMNNIGILYDEQGNYPKALEYYSLSLQIRNELGDKQGIAATLINIGMVYFAEKEYDNALDYYTRALGIAEESSFNKGIAASLSNIGDVYRERKDFDKASEYYEKALKITIETGDRKSTTSVFMSMGTINKERKNYDAAISDFEKSLAIAKENGDMRSQKDNYFLLAESYAALGNFLSAYEYSRKYSDIRDSLFSEESMVKLADMQTRYETEKKEKEIEFLTKEREFQDLKGKRNLLLLWIIGVAFALAAVTGIMIFLIWRNRQKARELAIMRESERTVLNKVVETEERERTRFAKDLHDGLGPLLSTVKLYVNELQDDSTDPEERKGFLQYTNELIDEAVKSTRSIANDLMPSMISDYGLIAGLKSFCDKISHSKTVNIHFSSSTTQQRFGKTTEIMLYRVVMEFINNTLKHSGASNITIDISEHDGKLSVYYSDDGCGFEMLAAPSASQTGMGLNNIMTRVKSLNGSCNISSSEGKGMRAKIIVPIQYDKINKKENT